MKKIVLFLLLVLFPASGFASTVGDFFVNRQSTYNIPRDVSNILVLDLTLPEPKNSGTLQLKSTKIHNAGTASHLDFSKLIIWEDGVSAGWDGDETEVTEVLAAPFFDTEILGAFKTYSKNDPWRRIFVTLDTSSSVYSLEERSIKLELAVNSLVFSDAAFNGPSDASIFGFERKIVYGSPVPNIPGAPFAGTPKVISESTIRWQFADLSNNEFGFKILDGNLKEVARVDEADLSYLDETGLLPDTEYSGRRVVAFNDRGESLSSTLSVFPAARTLALPKTAPVEETAAETPIVPVVEEVVEKEPAPVPTLFETIQTKIADLQRQINELIKQLNEFINQSAATVFGAFQGFLRAFLGK